MADSIYNIKLGITGNFNKSAQSIAKSVRGLNANFDTLGNKLNKKIETAKTIQQFSKLEQTIAGTAGKLQKAQLELGQLSLRMSKAVKPSEALTRQINKKKTVKHPTTPKSLPSLLNTPH